MPKLKYMNAITQALDEEMQRDERVFVIGEDVGEFGGVWNTSNGLLEKYSAQRVCDTPISEAAIIGTAVGAALTGLRPVVEIMYLDFITCAMDQVVNQAAKLRLMSGNRVTLPLVIRGPQGCGTREAAQHSQQLEAWFVHTPGLKVIAPSTVYDVKGLLKSAIRDDNPVFFIEHRLLYDLREEVPEKEWLVPIGEAVVRRQGTDVTILSYSYMMQKVLEAAGQLAPDIDVEVIDLRTLEPLDFELIAASVKKTGRCIVAHEAVARGGMGAEIIRRLTESIFGSLKAPPKVIGSAAVPMPFSPVLEDACIPQIDDIVTAVKDAVSADVTVS